MRLKRHPFTLVELIVSMAVFALLSMMVVRLFSASQKLWVSNIQKSEMSAEGRMALDMIADLLMSSTANPRYGGTNPERIGSDFFVLNHGGDSALGGSENTSQLYFVTKSDAQSLVGANNRSFACFVGIQVVHLSGGNYNDDPDRDHYVLVVGAKASGSGIPQVGGTSDFEVRFPDNTYTTGTDLVSFFNQERSYVFEDIITNNSHKVSRIATNVIDFQVRALDRSSDIQNGNGGQQVVTQNDNTPNAVEIELTLMDRRHYEDFINSTDSQYRQTLRNQFARTFRRVVWLDGTNKTIDMTGDWE